MKTGVIVYIAGDNPEDYNINHKDAVKKLKIDADRIEFMSHTTGHIDIEYAWWTLTVKGMERIICLAAEFTSFGTLQLTGRELRLCG